MTTSNGHAEVALMLSKEASEACALGQRRQHNCTSSCT